MKRAARNKERGYELEREVVVAAQEAGLEATRVFGSGAFKNELGEEFAGDVLIEGKWRGECKRTKRGLALITKAFSQDDADFVCVRTDRAPRFYVLREGTFHKLLKRERRERHEPE